MKFSEKELRQNVSRSIGCITEWQSVTVLGIETKGPALSPISVVNLPPKARGSHKGCTVHAKTKQYST